MYNLMYYPLLALCSPELFNKLLAVFAVETRNGEAGWTTSQGRDELLMNSIF